MVNMVDALWSGLFSCWLDIIAMISALFETTNPCKSNKHYDFISFRKCIVITCS